MVLSSQAKRVFNRSREVEASANSFHGSSKDQWPHISHCIVKKSVKGAT